MDLAINLGLKNRTSATVSDLVYKLCSLSKKIPILI